MIWVIVVILLNEYRLIYNLYPKHQFQFSANERSNNGVTVVGSNKINCQKSSPQFRWRRRKRRSKAQYPEMSQYLVPIDEGDEIQHLGRTLECTLCGLRGKRCHLTLHFKAKHSEVIDLHIPGRNINASTTQVTSTGNLSYYGIGK